MGLPDDLNGGLRGPDVIAHRRANVKNLRLLATASKRSAADLAKVDGIRLAPCRSLDIGQFFLDRC
jgi:hypothetical protein